MTDDEGKATMTMSDTPPDDVTPSTDAEPTPDEWLRAQASPNVERQHLQARLAAAVNMAEPDDNEEPPK